MMNWINVKERMPEKSGPFIVSTEDGIVATLDCSVPEGLYPELDQKEITEKIFKSYKVEAWMPMPDAYVSESRHRYLMHMAATQIWAICKESPEMGNAVMDLIGEEGYQNVLKFKGGKDDEAMALQADSSTSENATVGAVEGDLCNKQNDIAGEDSKS